MRGLGNNKKPPQKLKTKLPEIKKSESGKIKGGSPIDSHRKQVNFSPPLKDLLYETHTDPIKVKLVKKESTRTKESDRSKSPKQSSPFRDTSPIQPFEKLIKVSTLNVIQFPKIDERSPSRESKLKNSNLFSTTHHNSFVSNGFSISKSNIESTEVAITSTEFYQPEINGLNLQRNMADFEKKRRIKFMETIIEKGPKQNNEVKDKDNKEKEKEKDKDKNKKKVFTKFSELTPANIDSEKRKFFENNFQYHPVFNYNINEIQSNYTKVSKTHLKLAVRILDSCLSEYGSDSVFLESEYGRILTREETEKEFSSYIKKLRVEDVLSYEFSESTVAETYVKHEKGTDKSVVIIGLPIQYREGRIIGVLDHEIGTHFIRRFNNQFQPWHKKKKKYKMKPHVVTEEGLAALNQMFHMVLTDKKKPYLFKAALNYYAAVQASMLDFSGLFNSLEKYISNPDRRWKTCLRVKRGVGDTSQPGGMYKDQVYLKGAIEILRARKSIDFHSLHAGKMCLKDYFRLNDAGLINKDGLKYPYFLESIPDYLEILDTIAKTNFADV